MENDENEKMVMMNNEERKKANEFIIRCLQKTMNAGRGELGRLNLKLSATYWIIILLSIIMFLMGIVLLCVPLMAAFGQADNLQALIAGGFGIADLAALFLFRPIERIHKIMGDMSQIQLALNSYQTQVGLHLLEMDARDRQTLGIAAEKITNTTNVCIKLVQEYFEARETT